MRRKNTRVLKPLYAGLAATTIFAAILVLVTTWLSVQTRSRDEWVHHTLAVRECIAKVLRLVEAAESSQRGYLLTGQSEYLGPYNSSVKGLGKALDRAASLVADNPEQSASLNSLRTLIAQKLQELDTTIDERRTGHAQRALKTVNSDRGLRLMDEIERIVAKMETREGALLKDRETKLADSLVLMEFGAGGSFLLICGIGAMIGFSTRRSFRALAAAHSELMTTNHELVRQTKQREEAENQLRQSQKMEAIGQLTGGIAHDFNNMLGVIAGSLELMWRRIKKGDYEVERFVDAARTATERSVVLTDRLLAFARKQPLTPEVLQPNRMISNMSDLLHSTLGEHIEIQTVLAAGLWTTNVDANHLESAILNLAINARDAMPEGGKLTIETANAYLDESYCRLHDEIEPGQFVMIAVSDTGEGMTPEVIERVFDPFFTTKPAGSGTGLGLSQVYGFIKQSYGHVKLYSELNSGTSVKVYLPRHMGEAEIGAEKPSVSVEGGSANEAILVVEDDPLMRHVTSENLCELGYTVLDSENAIDALAILDNRPEIKLLFTDVVMPGTNGKKLAEEATRRRPELKVLFTTGYTQNAVVHGGVVDVGVEFITKPFTLEQLAAKVRTVLDK
jgi:signal transduction histidine kinase